MNNMNSIGGNMRKITLNDLAVMIKKGFDNTVDKKEFKELKLKVDHLDKKVDSGFLHLNASLELLKKEVEDIRNKLEKTITRKHYFEIDERLTIVEEKLGIKY